MTAERPFGRAGVERPLPSCRSSTSARAPSSARSSRATWRPASRSARATWRAHCRCRCRRPPIRNVMSDLEHLGLIYAPHTSAGRLPTESGLRLFVDGLLEVGDLDRRRARARSRPRSASGASSRIEQVLTEAGEMISGPVALRRRRAGRQAGEPAQAHRVRAARARQGAGRPGRRGPGRREPGHRSAAGLTPVEPDRGRQLPQRPHPRPDAQRGEAPRSRRSWPRPRPSSTSSPRRSSRPGSPPGRARSTTRRA